jgi:hypothetical protein
MTEEQIDDLIDVIFGTRMELREAMLVCNIKGNELEVEDELITRGLEPCNDCGRWLPGNELSADEDADPVCVECFAE